MTNPFAPELSPERREIFDNYRASCANLGPYTTREKSLFMLLHKFESVIEDINSQGVDGTKLYQELYFKYTQNDLTQEKPRSIVDDYDTSESWKTKPDIGFTSILSMKLMEKNLPVKDALYNAFVEGARTTKSADNPFAGDQQIERTDILQKHLFTKGLLPGLGNLLLEEKKAPQENMPIMTKLSKARMTNMFRRNFSSIGSKVLVYGIGMGVLTCLNHNGKDTTHSGTHIKADSTQTTEKSLLKRIFD